MRLTVLAVALVPLVTATQIVRTGLQDTRTEADAIVVLGAAQVGGRPGRVLEARLDQALSLYQAGYAPSIVTAGGLGRGRTVTEADAAAAWLAEQGVPRSDVLAVPEGGDTVSSLAAVADAAKAAGFSEVLVVTDPQHTYRSVEMATHVGLDVAGASPASSGPNVDGSPARYGFQVVRETAAYLTWRAELLADAAVDAARPAADRAVDAVRLVADGAVDTVRPAAVGVPAEPVGTVRLLVRDVLAT